MTKIVIPASRGAHDRVLKRAIAVLDHANIRADGKVLLAYPVLRVAEWDVEPALSVLHSAGIRASLHF